MPKPTLASQAKKHGITLDQIKAAGAHGVNVRNDEELRKHLDGLRHRIKPGTKIDNPEAAAAQTLEQMEEAIRKATNIDEVKILKEKVLALKGIVSVQQETRELVPSGEVREAMTAAYSVVRAELLKLTSDLPPQLAGLGESAIQGVLRSAIVDILARLSEETEPLFAEHESA